MANTTVQLSADTATKILTLEIPDYDNVTVSYETEADFTDFVERLLLLMDQDLQIDLSISGIESGRDKKLDLVLETIKEIIESYNDSFQSNQEPVEQQSSDGDDEFSF